MKIDFYKNSSTNNSINKKIELIESLECKLKNKENLYAIELILKNKLNSNCDYIYIDNIKKFYFIKDIENKGALWYITCECDLLETYKEDILKSKGHITIQENAYNKYNDSLSYITDSRKESIFYYSDTTVNVKNTTLLVTLRGK